MTSIDISGNFFQNFFSQKSHSTSRISVCYYHEDYVYSAKKYECQVDEEKFFEFEIKKPGHYYILLSQVDDRIYQESLSKLCKN